MIGERREVILAAYVRERPESQYSVVMIYRMAKTLLAKWRRKERNYRTVAGDISIRRNRVERAARLKARCCGRSGWRMAGLVAAIGRKAAIVEGEATSVKAKQARVGGNRRSERRRVVEPLHGCVAVSVRVDAASKKLKWPNAQGAQKGGPRDEA